MKHLKSLRTGNQFIEMFNKVCKEYHLDNMRTVVTVDNVDYIADEHYVRALQVVASRIGKTGDDRQWSEFNDRIQVWSDKKKTHRMIFRKDGIFKNEFSNSIYTSDSDMLFEIL